MSWWPHSCPKQPHIWYAGSTVTQTILDSGKLVLRVINLSHAKLLIIVVFLIWCITDVEDTSKNKNKPFGTQFGKVVMDILASFGGAVHHGPGGGHQAHRGHGEDGPAGEHH